MSVRVPPALGDAAHFICMPQCPVAHTSHPRAISASWSCSCAAFSQTSQAHSVGERHSGCRMRAVLPVDNLATFLSLKVMRVGTASGSARACLLPSNEADDVERSAHRHRCRSRQQAARAPRRRPRRRPPPRLQPWRARRRRPRGRLPRHRRPGCRPRRACHRGCPSCRPAGRASGSPRAATRTPPPRSRCRLPARAPASDHLTQTLCSPPSSSLCCCTRPVCMGPAARLVRAKICRAPPWLQHAQPAGAARRPAEPRAPVARRRRRKGVARAGNSLEVRRGRADKAHGAHAGRERALQAVHALAHLARDPARGEEDDRHVAAHVRRRARRRPHLRHSARARRVRPRMPGAPVRRGAAARPARRRTAL